MYQTYLMQHHHTSILLRAIELQDPIPCSHGRSSQPPKRAQMPWLEVPGTLRLSANQTNMTANEQFDRQSIKSRKLLLHTQPPDSLLFWKTIYPATKIFHNTRYIIYTGHRFNDAPQELSNYTFTEHSQKVIWSSMACPGCCPGLIRLTVMVLLLVNHLGGPQSCISAMEPLRARV